MFLRLFVQGVRLRQGGHGKGKWGTLLLRRVGYGIIRRIKQVRILNQQTQTRKEEHEETDYSRLRGRNLRSGVGR